MEGKRWDHLIKLEDKKLDMEKEEKEKDWTFELEKLDRQSYAETRAKKMEFVSLLLWQRQPVIAK
jgi:CTP:phosphocholine cytidylyltransferase-like protein